MAGLGDFISQLFSGGSQQPQVQPIQPLAANGQEPSPGNPPSPATDPFGATNSQLATVQSQNPAMQSIMQQQQSSTMDNTLKVLLPLIAGFAQESQLPRTAGPFSRIGAALGGGANTFLQMRQAEAQNALQRAQLQNEMRHQGITEQQGQEGLGLQKQKVEYETRGSGKDIFADIRKANPELDKSLPPSNIMSGLPFNDQIKLHESAVRSNEAAARVDEALQSRLMSHEDRQARIAEMAQANSNMYELRKSAIDSQVEMAHARMDAIKEQMELRKQLGQDSTDLKKQSLGIQKQLADLKGETDRNNIEQKYATQRDKRLAEYNKYWFHKGLTFEQTEAKLGYDPDTGFPIKKGKLLETATPDTGDLGAP